MKPRKSELAAVTTERIAAALRRAHGNVELARQAIGCSEYLIRERVKKDPILASLVYQLRHSQE